MARMFSTVVGVCATALLSTPELIGAGQSVDPRAERAALMTALEKLMITGEPRHTSHDEGESLQRAVTAAINAGDQEVERLAIRAAAPIVARVRNPVASIESPPSLEVEATAVLKLRREVAYRADVHASVDGSEFASLWRLQSGQRAGGKIHEGLPKHAFQPGYHSIRLKVYLAFGPPGQPLWTETRDLPHVAYALYDPAATDKSAASAFLTAPLRVSAQQLDASLPDLPFSAWLNTVLGSAERADRKHEWRMMYCAERTAEPGHVPRAGDLCSMMFFQIGASIGQLWIRTGELRFGTGGSEWVLDAPRFEAVTTNNGTTLAALPDLATLVKADPSTWPKSSVSVNPEDIAFDTTNTPTGAQTTATVTVRNAGRSPAYGVLVELLAATTDSDVTAASRHFVVDLPAGGSAQLKLHASLTAGYGFVFVHAMHVSEHSPVEMWNGDERPNSEVAFRVVNASLAPKGYVESIRAKCGCQGW